VTALEGRKMHSNRPRRERLRRVLVLVEGNTALDVLVTNFKGKFKLYLNLPWSQFALGIAKSM
jgi:hypothetical protein